MKSLSIKFTTCTLLGVLIALGFLMDSELRAKAEVNDSRTSAYC